MTPLHYAVKFDNIELVKHLLQNEANLFIRDYKLRMPGDFYGIDASLKNFLKEKKQEFEEQFIKEKKENKLDSKKSMNAFIDNPSRISTMKFL